MCGGGYVSSRLSSFGLLRDSRNYSSFFDFFRSHLEWGALNNAHQDRYKSVFVAVRFAHNRTNDGHILVFDSSAQGERHQFFGDRSHKLRGIVQKSLAKLDGSVDLRAVPQDGRRVQQDSAFAALLGPPLRVGIEIFERESDGIHQLVTA